jgi:hypothetical protein
VEALVRRLLLLLGAWLLPLLGACSPPPAPEDPTFAVDVQPILGARCIRCHHTPPEGDPPGFPSPVAGSTPQSDFTVYETPDDLLPVCPPVDEQPPRFCVFGAAKFAPLMADYIIAAGDVRMPPPPSPALTKRQIEIITRWAAQMPPAP